MKSKILLFFLFGSSLVASDYSFSTALEYSPIILDGHQKVGDDTIAGNTDFKDLGINQSEHLISPTINIIYKNQHKFYISLLALEYKGNNHLDNDITKDNYTYISDTKIDTKIDTTFISTGYRNIIGDVSYGIDIHSYKYAIEISDKLNSIIIDNSYIFPTVALDFTTKIKKYNIDYGANIGQGGDMNYFKFYLEAGYSFEYIKKAKVTLGYALSEFYISDGTYETFHRYQGTYLNLNIKF